MVRGVQRLGAIALVASVIGLFGAPEVAAQASKSEALAQELAALLDQQKLDTVAARDTEPDDGFVAALYFSGRQLLVVSARYESPSLLVEQLDARNYRDIYVDLQSASIPESKQFVDDLVADGLHPEPEEGLPFDTFTWPDRSVSFNGEWDDQDLSEQEYEKAFAEADEAYAHMLSMLIAELKGGS